MKKILVILILLSAGFLACATQAKKYDLEPESCFQARYMAREKQDSAVGILAQACAIEIKREWCLKVLKENPEIFKDFNDCWRQ